MKTILANVFVAVLIFFLIAYAIKTLIKQNKGENCASCSTKKGNTCKGCPYGDHCDKAIH
ncbi:MAG: hypothetical protein ACQ5SW_13545 [Sphaerochaetaceae bacterium]